YRAASEQVMALLHTVTPLVEQISIDEAFLDISDHAAAGAELARELQGRIRAELSLACSVGVGGNKLVAKIATDIGKAAARSGAVPNALCVVPAGEEAAFLAPLPTRALWGVGPRTAERLAELGIATIGQLAAWPAHDLRQRFGQHGVALSEHARGRDDRPIVTSHVAKSVSKETTFARDVRDPAALERTLGELAAGVARQLEKLSMVGTTVKLKLRWASWETLTRQVTLPQPTADAAVIEALAARLLAAVWADGGAVRLIGVGVSNLSSQPAQISLWDLAPPPSEQRSRLDALVRDIQDRFGSAALRWGEGQSEE
ncbi:MAG TPA: DNA polymerase IV, partial [Herpetosiphonaceae bacterium]|nr:DNA polymerase IV [Herpetosiphonaceae bacterium]